MISKTNFSRHPAIEAARTEVGGLISDPVRAFYDWDLPETGRFQRVPGNKVVREADWVDFLAQVKTIPNLVGLGKDRMVARIEGQPELVLSVFHEPKSWYYMQDLLRINHIFGKLFPHNFPRIHGFFGDNDMYSGRRGTKDTFYYTGIWTDYISGKSPDFDPLQEGLDGYRWDAQNFSLGYVDDPNNSLVRHPFKRVVDVSESIGLPLRALGFDPYRENFIRDENGGEKYIDLLRGPFHSRNRNFFNAWRTSETTAALSDLYRRGDFPMEPWQFKHVCNEIDLLGNQEP